MRPLKLQHLTDQLSLWADDARLTVGGVTYAGKGRPGTASCEAGSQTLCDFFANHAGSFVLGRNWVSVTPLFTEKFELLDKDIASIYFQCIYLDVNNGDKGAMSNATIGLPGQPGSALARKVHGHWLFWDVMAWIRGASPRWMFSNSSKARLGSSMRAGPVIPGRGTWPGCRCWPARPAPTPTFAVDFPRPHDRWTFGRPQRR